MADTLRIIPLGGVGEVGKNITVIEAGDEILVVDCGLAFPEPEMLGSTSSSRTRRTSRRTATGCAASS